MAKKGSKQKQARIYKPTLKVNTKGQLVDVVTGDIIKEQLTRRQQGYYKGRWTKYKKEKERIASERRAEREAARLRREAAKGNTLEIEARLIEISGDGFYSESEIAQLKAELKRAGRFFKARTEEEKELKRRIKALLDQITHWRDRGPAPSPEDIKYNRIIEFMRALDASKYKKKEKEKREAHYPKVDSFATMIESLDIPTGDIVRAFEYCANEWASEFGGVDYLEQTMRAFAYYIEEFPKYMTKFWEYLREKTNNDKDKIDALEEQWKSMVDDFIEDTDTVENE